MCEDLALSEQSVFGVFSSGFWFGELLLRAFALRVAVTILHVDARLSLCIRVCDTVGLNWISCMRVR